MDPNISSFQIDSYDISSLKCHMRNSKEQKYQICYNDRKSQAHTHPIQLYGCSIVRKLLLC